jgi:hypothetical protein
MSDTLHGVIRSTRTDIFIVRYVIYHDDTRVRDVQEDVFETYDAAFAFAQDLLACMGGSIDRKGRSASWVLEHHAIDGWVLFFKGIVQETRIKRDVWCPVRGDLGVTP